MMTRTLAFLLGGSLLALGSCENKARLVDASDATATEGGSSEATGTTGGGSGGKESSDGSSSDTGTPAFGISGVVIFQPVPEFSDTNVLAVRVWGGYPEGHTYEVDLELLGHVRERPTASPTPFFVELDPAEAYEGRNISLSAKGDMDGDDEYTCGDYRGSLDFIAPIDPEHVYEIVAEHVDEWCP